MHLSSCGLWTYTTRWDAISAPGSYLNWKRLRRKRHLVVDTLGLLLAVTVTAASVQDRDATAESVRVFLAILVIGMQLANLWR